MRTSVAALRYAATESPGRPRWSAPGPEREPAGRRDEHGDPSWKENLRALRAPRSFTAWVEATVADIAADPGAAGSFDDEDEICSFLVSTVSLAGLIFIAEQPMGPAEGDDMASTLAGQGLFLLDHPEWLRAMKRHAPLLTEDWYSLALEALVDAVENS